MCQKNWNSPIGTGTDLEHFTSLELHVLLDQVKPRVVGCQLLKSLLSCSSHGSVMYSSIV
ncbi:hypothetical protein J6590_025759 [Homalodisca vitripennis]|nr:hypothetical protein J6590_025759 [Homalodisca vitripennis]